MKGVDANWDLVVVGGGITGAGVFREAVRLGLKTLLVEQKDFAWGTSSRSSKLVHGGLRYLKEGRIFLTRDAVRERERLLAQAPGLVEPMGFLVPVYKGRGPGKWVLEAGLSIYDLIAKKRQHQYYNYAEFVKQAPHIDRKGLEGGFRFFDAQVDDARLVMRLIMEAEANGGWALNYTAAVAVNRNKDGQVSGVTLSDAQTRETRSVNTRAVINATGCWAENLHPSPDKGLHLRPLRGSHMIFPSHVLPLDQAVSFIHPDDKRAVFLVPWEGAVIAGTTDLDHTQSMEKEPCITPEEVEYLLCGLKALFPALNIRARSCISTIAGVRPVLSKGKRSPSEESREHVVWVDNGLVTITGGKLTTFRLLARDALKAAQPFLPAFSLFDDQQPVFSGNVKTGKHHHQISSNAFDILKGRYGNAAFDMIDHSDTRDLETIPGTRTLWAELSHAASMEKVVWLDDLLLRRVRVGLLTRNGGKAHLERVRHICLPLLGWDKKRWKKQVGRYLEKWEHAHGLPGRYKDSVGNVKTYYYRFKKYLGINKQRNHQAM